MAVEKRLGHVPVIHGLTLTLILWLILHLKSNHCFPFKDFPAESMMTNSIYFADTVTDSLSDVSSRYAADLNPSNHEGIISLLLPLLLSFTLLSYVSFLNGNFLQQ